MTFSHCQLFQWWCIYIKQAFAKAIIFRRWSTWLTLDLVCVAPQPYNLNEWLINQSTWKLMKSNHWMNKHTLALYPGCCFYRREGIWFHIIKRDLPHLCSFNYPVQWHSPCDCDYRWYCPLTFFRNFINMRLLCNITRWTSDRETRRGWATQCLSSLRQNGKWLNLRTQVFRLMNTCSNTVQVNKDGMQS